MKKLSVWSPILKEAEEVKASILNKNWSTYFTAKLDKYGVNDPADLNESERIKLFDEMVKEFKSMKEGKMKESLVKVKGDDEIEEKPVKDEEDAGTDVASVDSEESSEELPEAPAEEEEEEEEEEKEEGEEEEEDEEEDVEENKQPSSMSFAKFLALREKNKNIKTESVTEAEISKNTLELKDIHDRDHTRIIKWMSQNFHPGQYKIIKKSKASGPDIFRNYLMYVDKLTPQEIETVKNYLTSQDYLKESAKTTINEAEIKSDSDFTEYAKGILKKAFGDKYDDKLAEQTIKGILGKTKGDYGAAVGMLTSGLGK